jgi:hypothetical protein
MFKHRMFRIAAVLVTTIAAAGTLTLGSAGAAVTHTGRAVASHASAANLASSSSAAARPGVSIDAIHIQQTINGSVDCLDSSHAPNLYFNYCSAGGPGEVWSRHASTNGQYKLVNGTLCLDSNRGIVACSPGDGYQKWNLVLTTSGGSLWKIEQSRNGDTFCLDTQYGFADCAQGDGAQKFAFPNV